MSEQDFEKMPLTPYDEYPVHATAYPMSYIPASDPAWDDGYYYGVYDIESGVFLINGMRIAPNSNMIGGHSSLNINGVQRTLRLSRIWRDDFSVSIGPLRYEFIEPLRATRMVLEPNESGMSYDVTWRGLAPPHLSAHHRATRNGRYTTDQSRFNQVGTATGWIEIDGRRYDLPENAPWAPSATAPGACTKAARRRPPPRTTFPPPRRPPSPAPCASPASWKARVSPPISTCTKARTVKTST